MELQMACQSENKKNLALQTAKLKAKVEQLNPELNDIK